MLYEKFSDMFPTFALKDYYELEIATIGIMRSYMSVPCDMYFTMDRKVNKFIETTYKLYDVEVEKINEIKEFLKQFDFKKYAKEVLDSLFEYLESRT